MAKENYTLASLKELYGLTRLSFSKDKQPELREWLTAEGTLTDNEIKRLEFLRINLEKHVDGWLEESLKMRFISPVLEMVDYLYKEDPFYAFFDVNIVATIENHTLSAKPDLLLGVGVEDELRIPYFCLHEFKKSVPDKDPRAQLLVDMLISQTLNPKKQIVYGCYVIGKFWQFVVLEDKNYMISNSFDATDTQELHKIVFILRKFHDIILTLL